MRPPEPWRGLRVADPQGACGEEPLLEQARAARQELLSRLETLEPPLDREAISTLLGRESLGTAAIEEELLDPGQVRSSIARRLRLPLAEEQTGRQRPGGRPVGCVLEATSSLDAPLTLATLNHWHQLLFAGGPDGLRAVRNGELRDGAPMQVLSSAIGRERLHFEAPPRDQLKEQLEAFLDWVASPPAQLDGLLRAGLAHLWFLTLHPYEDGNGRLARAITDRLLAQDCKAQAQQALSGRALGLSAQILQERQGYYTALERCQRGDLHVTGWLRWFLEQLTAAALTNGAVIDAVRRKAAFWWSHRYSGFHSRQQTLKNRLLDAEPKGFTGGMTLRKAIGLTKVSRARHGVTRQNWWTCRRSRRSVRAAAAPIASTGRAGSPARVTSIKRRGAVEVKDLASSRLGIGPQYPAGRNPSWITATDAWALKVHANPVPWRRWHGLGPMPKSPPRSFLIVCSKKTGKSDKIRSCHPIQKPRTWMGSAPRHWSIHCGASGGCRWRGRRSMGCSGATAAPTTR